MHDRAGTKANLAHDFANCDIMSKDSKIHDRKESRKVNGGNMSYEYFSGENRYSPEVLCWSYSTLMAVKFRTKDNRTVFILNKSSYSNTTRDHQWAIEDACFGKVLNIYGHSAFYDPNLALEEMAQRIEPLLLKLSRARERRDEYINIINAITKNIIDYVEISKDRNFKKLYGKLDKRKLPKMVKRILNDEQILDEVSLKELNEIDKIKKRDRKKQAKEDLENAIGKFYNYEKNSIVIHNLQNSLIINKLLLIRLSKDNKRIETSKQVQIPLKLAVDLYNEYVEWKKGNYKGKRTEKILNFEISEHAFQQDSIVIGCHNIPVSEMERVYKEVVKKGLLKKILQKVA